MNINFKKQHPFYNHSQRSLKYLYNICFFVKIKYAQRTISNIQSGGLLTLQAVINNKKCNFMPKFGHFEQVSTSTNKLKSIYISCKVTFDGFRFLAR